MTIETAKRSGSRTPSRDEEAIIVFALHFLGGSAGQWQALVGFLQGRHPWVSIDLPGFGDASGLAGHDVAAMAEHVAAIVRHRRPRRWALVGHSMGAKVAAVVARWAEDGAPGLNGLMGIILLAASPPGPEPMTDDKRASMLGWFNGDEAARRADADCYIEQNVGASLPQSLHALAVAGVLQADRTAWTAWLEQGSREDWASRVGLLTVPALIVAGAEDAGLGTAIQVEATAPHFANRTLVTLDGGGHLLPLEKPAELADLIASHLDRARSLAGEPVVAPSYRALMKGDRVSARTRRVLEARATLVHADPAPLSDTEFATLRAIVDRIVPQPTERPYIDLAARITLSLRLAEGDGWRFAELPPDAEAYAAGLTTLNALAVAQSGSPFDALDEAAQDALLERIAAGQDETSGSRPLSAAQIRLWFEDVCAAATRAYVAHPETLGRIGYSGIANGGDGPHKQGFRLVGPGEREDWEPTAHESGSR